MNVERLRELFDLDLETGVLRWRVSRGGVLAGSAVGSKDRHGYLKVRVGGRFEAAHRIVFLLVNGYLPEEVDHRNGVRSDNTPSNLRAASRTNNKQNARTPNTNRSGVKGVSWFCKVGKWRADCSVSGRKHYLGSFETKSAAEAAVRAFREKHHGEFARHE